jgi:hypothetical protein
MFKRAEQMEVAWSKVGAIRRMLEDFPVLLLTDNARPHTTKDYKALYLSCDNHKSNTHINRSVYALHEKNVQTSRYLAKYA